MSSKRSKGGGRKAPSVWERRAQVEKDIAMKLARELESVKAELRLQSGCCDGAAAQDAHVRREREEHKAEVERLRTEIDGLRGALRWYGMRAEIISGSLVIFRCS